MLAQGKPPSEKQLEILVRFHADARRPLRLFHMYRKMRTRFGVSPRRTFLYNRIIDALVSCGRLDFALEVYDDLRSDDGLKEDAVTFTIICKGFCRAGRIDELVDMIDRMRSEVCRPDVFAYTAMVKILISEGNVDGGLRVWDEMVKDGVEADVMAYSTLIAGLCKAGRMEKGKELFKEMKKKGFLIERAVYGALVEGFVDGGQVESGAQILKEMVGDGYRADLGIYNLLIKGFCADGKVDKALKIFQIVIMEGIEPEFSTLLPLLITYADGNQMDMLYQFVDRISELGLPVIDHLSSFFTAYLVKGGREMKALEVFEVLKSKGYCSVAIYNILIDALHKIKEMKKALLLFEELNDTEHLKPDSCTYSLVITCIAEDGDAREACSYFNRMKENYWTPSVAAYSSLVRGLCMVGEINAAMTLVKDCLGNVTSGPMEFKYSLRVLDACRSGKPEKVIEVLNEMVEQGYPLEDIIYCTVIHGFCKYASSGEARKVLEFMKKSKRLTEANFIVYEEMLNEHLKKETAGLEILDIQIPIGIYISVVNFLGQNSEDKNWAMQPLQASQLVARLKEQGYYSSLGSSDKMDKNKNNKFYLNFNNLKILFKLHREIPDYSSIEIIPTGWDVEDPATSGATIPIFISADDHLHQSPMEQPSLSGHSEIQVLESDTIVEPVTIVPTGWGDEDFSSIHESRKMDHKDVNFVKMNYSSWSVGRESSWEHNYYSNSTKYGNWGNGRPAGRRFSSKPATVRDKGEYYQMDDSSRGGRTTQMNIIIGTVVLLLIITRDELNQLVFGNDLSLYTSFLMVPELMLAQGKPPSEKQLEILVRFHADARRPLRLFHMYRKMRTRFGVSPRRTFLYNRIIDALVSCGRLDLALEVYDDLRSDDGLKEDAVTFTIICKGFCRAGRIDELVDLIGRMRSEVCRPDVFAYTAMVKILISEGNVDGGLRVWDEMVKDGVEADVMAYSTLIAGLCKAGRMERGKELFKEMKKKGFLIERAVYGALVEGFVDGGQVESGAQILKEMVGDGYRADLGIYNLLIKGFCADGKVDKALKIFQIVIMEGIEPEFSTLLPLLITYADGNQMDMLYQFVDRISELGLPVIDHLSSFFTAYLVKGGREMKALEVFEVLKSKGYCSVAIYNILIDALHKIKEMKKALLLFEELNDTEHLKPDSCTYSLVITCIAEDGDAREACSYFNRMKENYWTPSVAAYSSLVRGLCMVGEINAAMTLVKDCLGNVTSGPMEFKYSLRVLDACRSGKPEKVIEVLNEMVEQGYPLEDIIYCTVIHGFCKYASSGEARKVLEFMKKSKRLTEANFIVYEEMLNEHLKKETAGLEILDIQIPIGIYISVVNFLGQNSEDKNWVYLFNKVLNLDYSARKVALATSKNLPKSHPAFASSHTLNRAS
ncbi:hypothetical protein M5K25_003114 [Dendrobium thyrsiflorum]|uniref:Pentatricopeptide repeat-containing protein n=1 Tax=Dendrobium thyrsiflorum TaxID=117978 RepID=A0ABD0VVJ5_DENTH